MSNIRAGAVDLFYAEEGKGGSSILFTHGIPTDYRVWNDQLRFFSSSFRAISYSRRHASPNENRSLDVLESTVPANSEDQISLIQHLEKNPIHLVGHSYGGFVSLYTAWKHPELLKTLILVEPAVPSMLVKNEKNVLDVFAFLLSNPGAATSARKFQTGFLKKALEAFERHDETNAVRYFYDGIREDPQGFDKLDPSVRDMMNQNGKTIGELETEFPILTKKDAKEIRLPTLLVKGEKSPKWLRAIVDALSRSIPKSKIVEISGSGHLPHIENPLEFNSKVIDFLKETEA